MTRQGSWKAFAALLTERSTALAPGSGAGSSTGDSGRVHAVEEVRAVLLPVLEARLRMQAESLAAFCNPKVPSLFLSLAPPSLPSFPSLSPSLSSDFPAVRQLTARHDHACALSQTPMPPSPSLS